MKVVIAASVILLMASAVSAQGLKNVRFPDGSGKVGVAAGWNVKQSGNGAVVLGGPGGAEVMLGINIPVISSNVGQQYAGSGIPDAALFPGSARVNFNNPVIATLDMVTFLARQAKVPARITKIRRVEPVAWANGRAALVQFSSVVNGKPIETYGLFAIQPIDNVQALFYFSSVAAPAGNYAKALPTMLAMWKSWGVSQDTQRQRLEAASKSLAEVDWAGAMDSVTQHRRQVAETAARQFDRYIRQ
ncbi:MAG: hypothetical protein QM758_19555 [Armatimonas sp.]